jgi:hypothetical protein
VSVTPIQHETVTYDVHDFHLYPLLTDPVDGTAAPTYGEPVDAPGIAEVSLDPNFATAQLKGDARVIARKGRVDALNISATYGKVSLEVIKTLLGGVITDAAGSADWSLGGTNSLPYFGVAFAIMDLDTGLGALHGYLFKAQLTGGRLLNGSTDNFGQPTMAISGQPANNGAFGRLRLMSASTPLPATATAFGALATAA